MSHNLILDALHHLQHEFVAARPSQPAKALLRAEVAKLAKLVDDLPDDDARAPAPTVVIGNVAPLDPDVTVTVGPVAPVAGAVTMSSNPSESPLDSQGQQPQDPSHSGPDAA